MQIETSHFMYPRCTALLSTAPYHSIVSFVYYTIFNYIGQCTYLSKFDRAHISPYRQPDWIKIDGVNWDAKAGRDIETVRLSVPIHHGWRQHIAPQSSGFARSCVRIYILSDPHLVGLGLQGPASWFLTKSISILGQSSRYQFAFLGFSFRF